MEVNYDEVVLENKIIKLEYEIKSKQKYLKELKREHYQLVKKNREEGNY